MNRNQTLSMKITLLLVTACLLTMSLVYADGEVSNYAILNTGSYHADELVFDSSLIWYGLFPCDSGTVLEETDLVVTRCVDVVVDEGNDTTGYCVAAVSGESPVFLIGSRAPMRERRVRPLRLGQETWLELGNTVEIGNWTIAALGEITDEGERPPYDLLTTNYRIRLYDNNDPSRAQTLFETDRLGADATPSLVWAGDLDGDSRPDLLLDITDHYNVRHLALYLSGEADPGRLVKLVAELRTTGC